MSWVRALIIEPGGQCSIKNLPNHSPESLTTRQEIVGGYIEAFSFSKVGSVKQDAHLWLNEDGKYSLGPDYYNGLATDLVRHMLFPGDWVCGTVAVCGEGRNGEDGDVPDWVVSTVRAYPDCKWVGPEPSEGLVMS